MRESVWALTFDWLHGASQDLLDEQLQLRILRALEDRLFAAVGLAPICSSCSTAVTPPIRSAQFPEGLPTVSVSFAVKLAQGNAHASFVVRVVRVLVP